VRMFLSCEFDKPYTLIGGGVLKFVGACGRGSFGRAAVVREDTDEYAADRVQCSAILRPQTLIRIQVELVLTFEKHLNYFYTSTLFFDILYDLSKFVYYFV
jgi:hypothetical protein